MSDLCFKITNPKTNKQVSLLLKTGQKLFKDFKAKLIKLSSKDVKTIKKYEAYKKIHLGGQPSQPAQAHIPNLSTTTKILNNPPQGCQIHVSDIHEFVNLYQDVGEIIKNIYNADLVSNLGNNLVLCKALQTVTISELFRPNNLAKVNEKLLSWINNADTSKKTTRDNFLSFTSKYSLSKKYIHYMDNLLNDVFKNNEYCFAIPDLNLEEDINNVRYSVRTFRKERLNRRGTDYYYYYSQMTNDEKKEIINITKPKPGTSQIFGEEYIKYYKYMYILDLLFSDSVDDNYSFIGNYDLIEQHISGSYKLEEDFNMENIELIDHIGSMCKCNKLNAYSELARQKEKREKDYFNTLNTLYDNYKKQQTKYHIKYPLYKTDISDIEIDHKLKDCLVDLVLSMSVYALAYLNYLR